MITLKDNTQVKDRRLGRCIEFDEMSRAFPIRTLVADKPPVNKKWDCSQILDQGVEGACVGFGLSHELIAAPDEVKGLTNQTARELYWLVQHKDPWPGGAYPDAVPFYEGTSVLSGLKTLVELGYCDSFHWGFGIDDVLKGVSYEGPAVIGSFWWKSMYNPTSCCNRISPKGEIAGGHCYILNEVNWDIELVGIVNSWGLSWGDRGRAYITFKDMEIILKNEGEAAFLIGRHKVPQPKKSKLMEV